MKVTELSPAQLDYLRQDYSYTVNGTTGYVSESDVPNSELFDAFEGVEFVPEDFPE